MLNPSVALKSPSYENSTDLSTVMPGTAKALSAKLVDRGVLSMDVVAGQQMVEVKEL
jgi:hypothetical protein